MGELVQWAHTKHHWQSLSRGGSDEIRALGRWISHQWTRRRVWKKADYFNKPKSEIQKGWKKQENNVGNRRFLKVNYTYVCQALYWALSSMQIRVRPFSSLKKLPSKAVLIRILVLTLTGSVASGPQIAHLKWGRLPLRAHQALEAHVQWRKFVSRYFWEEIIGRGLPDCVGDNGAEWVKLWGFFNARVQVKL